MFKGMDASADDKPSFGKQSLYVHFPFDFVDCGFRDTEPGTKPAPQGGRYHKLTSPAAKAFPFGSTWWAPKPDGNDAREFLQNAVSV